MTAAAHIVDSRLQQLDHALPSLFRDRRILDIGCNSGGVALDLALHFQPKSVRGVDVDPQLIYKAKSSLSYRYSRLGPDGEPDFFPASSVQKYGHRAYPTDPDFPGFPRNVSFVIEDWGEEALNTNQEATYDVVLALSVIKWIHIHHQDEGLERVFTKCHAAISVGGYLVLEPQDWESYGKAAKKNSKLKRMVESLRQRPEDFTGMLLDIGFELVMKLNEEVRRDIFVFKKK